MTFEAEGNLKSTSLCRARNTKKNLFARGFSSRPPVRGHKPLTQRAICRVSGDRKAPRNK
jgi:hypothetical protein